MEKGYNVNRKGRRSHIRLNPIRQRIVWAIANLEIDDITQATDRQILEFEPRDIKTSLKLDWRIRRIA